MKHGIFVNVSRIGLLLALCLVLSSCGAVSYASVGDDGPVPPYGSSSLLGKPKLTQPIVEAAKPITIAEAQSCLADGRKVYALALQNTNVRTTTDVNSCRIGRIAKGTLVQVTDVYTIETVNAIAPAAQAAQAVQEPTGAAGGAVSDRTAIGYVEDIQPIFVSVCNTCHSALIKNKDLQVTAYAPLMRGSISGTVVIPGDAASSVLWQNLTGARMPKMPLIGELSAQQMQLVKDWIDSGAPERRPVPAQTAAATPAPVAALAPALAQRVERLWLSVDGAGIAPVSDTCETTTDRPLRVASADLLLPVSCDQAPQTAALDALRISLALPASAGNAIASTASSASATRTQAVTTTRAISGAVASAAEPAVAAPAPAAARPNVNAVNAAQAGIQAKAFGLAAPSDGDGWFAPRGGFCLEQRLADNTRAITAISFAPDGRIFLALDANMTRDIDPLIMYDAYHPSRSVVVYDGVSQGTVTELLSESPRITGLDWENGALYITRAGEVGRIPDGGTYEKLADGFAVNSQLFHANNGIVVSNGWVYVSAGGIIDGYSDGPLVGIGEAGAQQIVSGGNPYAARIVRAPLDGLLSQRSIATFSTAARGVRNPYGITADPGGRIWFTDNGATNVAEGVSAGDEVNVLNPAAAGGGEEGSPYYGFPLALSPPAPEWYSTPVSVLPNTSAPTGITWAYGTIYYGQYGRDPGLYRLGSDSNGKVVAERIMLAWPVLAVTTAPDGALWVGTGGGGLYRMTPGCGQ